METSKQSRSWLPRFSLRALLVLVTLFALFIAYQARWIKQRRDYLKLHPIATSYSSPSEKPVSAPMLIGMWGEAGQTQLIIDEPDFWKKREFHKKNPGSEAEEARKLFPEAIIEVKSGFVVYYTWMPGHEWDWGTKK